MPAINSIANTKYTARLELLDDCALWWLRDEAAKWASSNWRRCRVSLREAQRAMVRANQTVRSGFWLRQRHQHRTEAQMYLEAWASGRKSLRLIDAEFYARGYAEPPTRQPAIGGRGYVQMAAE